MEERRMPLPLHPDDQKRLVRIETLCEGILPIIKEHSDRIRDNERRVDRHAMGWKIMTGIVTAAAGWFGYGKIV